MPDVVRYRWQLLRAGPLRLDGGSLFGVVPRVVWSKNVSVDEQGRIELAHNCLLLNDNIVIETGSGDKFDEKNRKIFGLTDHSIIDAVHDASQRCDAIRHVIVTHLHFDHAGGLMRRSLNGPVPTFPNATIYVQQREWEDACTNRSVMTRTYLPENRAGIEHQLNLLHAPSPFAVDHLPQRDELPQSMLVEREIEVLRGLHVFLVPGHTWGQQAVRFTDERGQIIVFTPDVLPTVHHIGAAYNMAYDVEPYISTVTRRWFLREAAERDWLLVLDHEPDTPCVRVEADGNGWFRLIPVAPAT